MSPESTPDLLDRLTVVLVRARNPHNIGAAARAMHDFGLRHLRVVNEYAPPFEGARSAVDASAVLTSATIHATLAEAIPDCTLVIGTTSVGERQLQHSLITLPDAAQPILDHLRADPGHRVALLFGSEKTGLSNEELSFCSLLLTIPMYEHADIRHPSMNLGQAVAVCLYELVRDPAATSVASPVDLPEAPPTSSELDHLASLLGEVLEVSGYTRRHPTQNTPADLRRLVRRIGADRVSAPVWFGILRQLVWKLRQE